MTIVKMYTKQFCPFCIRAKALLEQKGVSFEEISVDGKPDLQSKMATLAGRHTVPQIFINEQPIGGCDELHALEASGELDQLLNR